MKKMSMFCMSLLVFCGVSLISNSLFAGDEEEIALSEVPEIVKNAAETALPGVELVEAELEKKKSGERYELKGKVDGKTYELKIKPDGTLIKKKLDNDKKGKRKRKEKKEEDVALADVPQKVKDAALQTIDGLILLEAELEKKKSGDVYELEGKVDGKVYEFKITPDGTLLKMKLELDDDDDEDDDDDK